MKKKILIIIIAVLFGGGLLYFGSGIIRYKLHFKNMKPVITGSITEDVWVLQTDFVNSYLIKTNEENYIAVDAGMDVKKLEDEIKKVNINPLKITHVFLTHTDYDHVNAVSVYSNAEIFILSEEKEMVNGKTSRGPFMKNSLKVPYSIVRDGQIIDINNLKIEVIAVPGHTLGSACYKINNKYLFTGDVLKINNGRGEVFIKDFNMNNNLLKKSLKKLLKHEDVQMIFTGHFGYSKNPEHVLKEIE